MFVKTKASSHKLDADVETKKTKNLKKDKNDKKAKTSESVKSEKIKTNVAKHSNKAGKLSNDDSHGSAQDVLTILQKRTLNSKKTKISKLSQKIQLLTDLNFGLKYLARNNYLKLSFEEEKNPNLILNRKKNDLYELSGVSLNPPEPSSELIINGNEKKQKRKQKRKYSQDIEKKQNDLGHVEKKSKINDLNLYEDIKETDKLDLKMQIENQEKNNEIQNEVETRQDEITTEKKPMETERVEKENKKDEIKMPIKFSTDPIIIGDTQAKWPIFNHYSIPIYYCQKSLEWLKHYRTTPPIPETDAWQALPKNVQNALLASLSFECVFRALKNRSTYGMHASEWINAVPDWVNVEWGLSLLDNTGLLESSHATEPRDFLQSSFYTYDRIPELVLKRTLEPLIDLDPKRFFALYEVTWSFDMPKEAPFSYSYVEYLDIPQRVVFHDCKNRNKTKHPKVFFIKRNKARKRVVCDLICGIVSWGGTVALSRNNDPNGEYRNPKNQCVKTPGPAPYKPLAKSRQLMEIEGGQAPLNSI